MKLRSFVLAVACACACACASAAPQFVNGILIPGNTPDLSGDTGVNQRFGMFSDVYYDRVREEWWGLGDRGPGGGTLSYETRVQRFTLDINPVTGAISNLNIVETVKFFDATGTQPFNGLAPSPANVLGQAFDPEGFVVNSKTGRFLVSDEYGPALYEFNRNGTLHRTFTTPANLTPRNGASVNHAGGDPEPNTAGRRTNRGFEGLAISPDGKYSFAMLQSAMLDEGAGNGVYVRIVKFDNATGEAVAQYAYQMEGSSQGRGISALVALNDHEFLVLERNNRGVGVDSELTPGNKKVFRIDLNSPGDHDVSGVTLPATGALPGGKTPVGKVATPFIAIDATTLAAFGGRQAEKWEGFAIGPKVGDQYMMLAGTDNDFSVTQNANGVQFDVYYKPGNPNGSARIQCDLGTFNNCMTINANGAVTGPFAGSLDGFELIPGLLYSYLSTGNDLAAFVAPTPVPATWTMLLGGLGLLGFARRRK